MPRKRNHVTPLCCAYRNNAVTLKYTKTDIITNPIQIHRSICTIATKHGHLECLKHAHENGWPWSKLVCRIAAEKGYHECLKWLHENGCPWDETICEVAAKNGYSKCLRYAYENGCPLSADICTTAAANGHLDCLKYLHNLYIIVTDDITDENYFDECILQYHTYHINDNTYNAVVNGNHYECIRYVTDNMYVVMVHADRLIRVKCYYNKTLFTRSQTLY